MSDIVIDDAKKKVLKDFCGEMSSSMTRAEAERDFQKEAINDFSKSHEIDKKLLRKMAKSYHKQNFFTTKEENSQFEETYAKVFEVDKVV